MTKTSRVVSEKNLLKRINRKLKGSFHKIKKSRNDPLWLKFLGHYYRVDRRNNSILEKAINLEAFAREEGVLKGSEELIWD